jgi:hypothetical protein
MTTPTVNSTGIYSTRWTNISYTGQIFTFRRSSDSVIADFYVSRSGEIKNAAGDLTTWASSNTIYVTKWWDQSTNGKHAEQTTTLNQPTFDTIKKCIKFDGTTQFFNLPDNTIPSGNNNYTVIIKHGIVNNSSHTIGTSAGLLGSGTNNDGNSNSFAVVENKYSNFWYIRNALETKGTYSANNTVTWKYTGSKIFLYTNGTYTASGDIVSPRNSVVSNNYIGRADPSIGQYLKMLNGELYYISIYNAALDDATRSLAEFPVFDPPPCFLQGSKILHFDPESNTESYVPVETLRKGDLVKTFMSGYKPVSHIGFKQLDNPAKNPDVRDRLYGLTAKQVNPDSEFDEPLYLTGRHSVLRNDLVYSDLDILRKYMGDVFVTENHYRVPIFMDQRAKPYTNNEPVTIWHFALEHPDIEQNYGVYANGILVESSSAEYMTEHSNMKLLD